MHWVNSIRNFDRIRSEKQPGGVHAGESKVCCTLEMRPAAEAQKCTFLRGRSVSNLHTVSNNDRITNVQRELMSWLKVASPSSQQAAHQNQAADTFHTPSFMWAFQGITPCSGDQAAKRRTGMMSQVMLSVHVGMWKLIYRREHRGEGLGPEINLQSSLVGVQFLLLFYTHQLLTAFITVHLLLVVTGHKSSQLPTPGT